MNEVLGATGKQIGGILKEEQLKSILGEPTEETKWVWMEGEEKEKKMENSIPVWRKIIFDGRKIQIRLNAWPSIFSKKEFKEDNENTDKESQEKNKEMEELEGKLVYRLNFDVEFKRPEEQLDINAKIDNIKTLAQTFSSNPSSENAEELAKQAVTAEKNFKSYFQQANGKCEDMMASILALKTKEEPSKFMFRK